MRNQWQQGKMITLGPHGAEFDAPKPGIKDFVFPQVPHPQVNPRHLLHYKSV